MTVRIRPRDFTKDFLERNKEIEILSNMFSSLEGPCVLAVDAPWGYGKTTFIELLNNYLQIEKIENQQKKKYHTIKFNAWGNDFAGDPFVSLLTELKRQIEKITSNDKKLSIIDCLNNLIEDSRLVIEVRIYFLLLNLGMIDIRGSITNRSRKNSPDKNIVNRYDEYTKYKDKFNKTLENLAKCLYEDKELPLIIMIDELDRCRPDYAIQLLEVVKHFFSVDHVIFVLAISSSQIIHSIKAVYGQDFDAQEYLRRFFDIDFKLPNRSRENFINNMLETENIKTYFNDKKILEANRTGLKFTHIENILKNFFGASDMSLRQISHSIHRLGFILTSLPKGQELFIVTTVVALVFRTFEPELYHNFCQGHVSDSQAIDAISSHPIVQDLQDKEEWHIFVAILILSYCEIKNILLSSDLLRSNDSPLMTKYVSSLTASDKTTSEYARVEKIMGKVKQLLDKAESLNLSIEELIGFRQSTGRIEMFS